MDTENINLSDNSTGSRIIRDYEIISPLGRGGQSHVYAARLINGPREFFAFKVFMDPDEESRKRAWDREKDAFDRLSSYPSCSKYLLCKYNSFSFEYEMSNYDGPEVGMYGYLSGDSRDKDDVGSPSNGRSITLYAVVTELMSGDLNHYLKGQIDYKADSSLLQN